jgi:hypothetical protein
VHVIAAAAAKTSAGLTGPRGLQIRQPVTRINTANTTVIAGGQPTAISKWEGRMMERN